MTRCPYCGKEIPAKEFAKHHATCPERAKYLTLERWVSEPIPEYKPTYTGFDIYFRKGKDDFVNIFQLKEAPERYVVTYVHRERPPPWIIEPPRTYKWFEDLTGWKQVERKIKELRKEGYVEVPKSEVYWHFW